MFNSLIEVSRSDLFSLRDLYLVDWPKNRQGYNLVQNYINQYNKYPELKDVKVVTLNEGWMDGTFLIIDRSHIMINSLSENNHRLLEALSLIDWTGGYTLCAYEEKHRPTLRKFVRLKELDTSDEWPALWFMLSKEEGSKLKIELPKDISLRPLDEKHAVIVNELWPHRHPDSIQYLKRLIKMNKNIGAFTKDDELIGWCLRMEYGSLGTLHVKDSYKRKGIGTAIVKYLTKYISDQNEDTFASVLESNIESKNLFSKIGFKITGNAYWMNVNRSVIYHSNKN